MKAIGSSVTRSLSQKSRCFCTDNSGAKEVEIISAIGYHGKKRTLPKAGIADMVTVVIKKGRPDVRKKVERAVIVRVKHAYRRADGSRVAFEDNAVVLVDEKGLPKASEVKGVVAKEVGERWPKIAGLASAVI
ncbi:MAG: 50S ribosomal protein L14 [Candidatus Diapherotrites archaeon]|uniref:Large ribosomal subunit protein uL14 n=1 Tax=Candidatus Iainarchaeum sp. TaxID=3101447 RepID=A0A2D6M0Q7_9ARCH|nr:50S ribosomal protein L14 [Candidatus Diapherotrites archaeon]|tara:strand:+ start:1615 stop:2013 length:399 start_codon:yes stop_codon:yes gene_type:complete